MKHTKNLIETLQYNPSKNNASKSIDSGRSMVEMLGVLAIIGILSIGGIAGYKAAMRKYQTNEFINELNLVRVSVMQILANKPDHPENIELEMDKLTKSGYPISLNFETTETGSIQTNSFFLRVENIPNNICQELIQMRWNGLNGVFVVEEGNNLNTHCGNANTVTMDFDFGTMDENSKDNSENYPEIDQDSNSCSNKTCVGECMTGNCQDGICQIRPDYSICSGGGRCQSGECIGSSEENGGGETNNPYACDQHDVLSEWDIDTIDVCQNRFVQCDTTGSMDCYSYLTACPTGYSEVKTFEGWGSCESGEVMIAKSTSERGWIDEYACCHKD